MQDIEASLDPETNQPVVYWSDIQILFPNAHHIKRGNTMVTFVRNAQQEWYVEKEKIRIVDFAIWE